MKPTVPLQRIWRDSWSKAAHDCSWQKKIPNESVTFRNYKVISESVTYIEYTSFNETTLQATTSPYTWNIQQLFAAQFLQRFAHLRTSAKTTDLSPFFSNVNHFQLAWQRLKRNVQTELKGYYTLARINIPATSWNPSSPRNRTQSSQDEFFWGIFVKYFIKSSEANKCSLWDVGAN